MGVALLAGKTRTIFYTAGDQWKCSAFFFFEMCKMNFVLKFKFTLEYV